VKVVQLPLNVTRGVFEIIGDFLVRRSKLFEARMESGGCLDLACHRGALQRWRFRPTLLKMATFRPQHVFPKQEIRVSYLPFPYIW
jgi:hypothetical protein